ncbi:MAG: hypothetical protein WCG80_19470 [Spirochaetales bacterium]
MASFIRSLAREHGMLGGLPAASSVIDELIALNLAQRVDITPSGSRPSRQFVVVDFASATSYDLDPLELAQAFVPDGVLCYFSALCFHELTTQAPSFYHVAELDHSIATPRVNVRQQGAAVSDSRQPLGTRAFEYQGVPIYSTKRLARTLVGLKTYVVGPRTSYRMTSVEQTLVDCLHRPGACGGPSVVFEAWKKGVERISQSRLAAVLEASAPVLRRRTATMLESFGTKLEQELLNLLDIPPKPVVPLLNGYPAGETETRWGVSL